MPIPTQQFKLLNSKNVLLVDDDLEQLRNYEQTMALFFSKVYTATNGFEGLETFRKNTIQLIITDYEMPIMNGIELIKEVRAMDPYVPAAIISNYDDKEKLKQAIPLNLLNYISKPVTYSKFKSLLTDVVNQLTHHTLQQYRKVYPFVKTSFS